MVMPKRNLELRIEVVIIFIVFTALATFFVINFSLQQTAQEQNATTTQTLTQFNLTRNITVLKVPAVDNRGNGIVTTMEVDSVPGSGRTLVDIENLLFFTDTQTSIQTAKSVAENITGMNASNIDLIYSINTNAQLVEGPSAGAALTVATIATLENKTLNPNVMITGTINPDGTIGPVGGVVAKAEAAKEVGAKIFLVPTGQGTQTTYQPQTNCQTQGQFTFCQTQYQSVTTNINTTAGIQVIEVGTIQEALKYFLS